MGDLDALKARVTQGFVVKARPCGGTADLSILPWLVCLISKPSPALVWYPSDPSYWRSWHFRSATNVRADRAKNRECERDEERMCLSCDLALLRGLTWLCGDEELVLWVMLIHLIYSPPMPVSSPFFECFRQGWKIRPRRQSLLSSMCPSCPTLGHIVLSVRNKRNP